MSIVLEKLTSLSKKYTTQTFVCRHINLIDILKTYFYVENQTERHRKKKNWKTDLIIYTSNEYKVFTTSFKIIIFIVLD